MRPWSQPAKRAVRNHRQSQTTQSPGATLDLFAGSECQRRQSESKNGGSGKLAAEALASTLCEPEHTPLKRNDDLWTAAPFAGIQPVGRALWECRHCPACGSTVIRPVSVGRALALLIDALLAIPPTDSTLRSAMLLSRWAEEHLPLTLRSMPQSAERQAHHGDAAQYPL